MPHDDTPHNDTYVLGVYLGHDLGACLLKNGQIRVMVEEERLNRYKHGRPNSEAGLWRRYAGRFGYFPWASVSYCLQTAGIGIDDIALMAVGDSIWGAGAADTISEIIPLKDPSKVVFIRVPEDGVHHYHHALSAFYASPFESAAVLVIDADGTTGSGGYEAESGYEFHGRSGEYTEVFKNRYASSHVPRQGIGWTYEHVTQLIGFTNPEIYLADAGKTMGLASYGKENPELLSPWITSDGVELDFTGFHRWLEQHGHLDRLQDLRRPKLPMNQFTKDLAWKVQKEIEDAILGLAHELHRRTGQERLCMAGGVALNSVANARLAQEGPFKEVFIQPAASDSGQALGIAYHAHLLAEARKPAGTPRVPIQPMRHAYTGRTHDAAEIKALLERCGLPFEEHEDALSLADAAAVRLAQGEVLGWFQGGSEIGPRALGHRSILAHPGIPGMQERLNRRVKFREGFRPFAPAVLAERSAEIFAWDRPSPYMLFIAPVREDWQSRLPAITHVDGTARLQTVSREDGGVFYQAIAAFDRLTGLPVVLNTSFNLRGMPIVESPYDALLCFLFTEMDCLFLENIRVGRPSRESAVPFWSASWSVSLRERLGGGTAIELSDRSGERRHSFSADAALGSLARSIDGRRSLAELGANEPAMPFIQQLLRAGALGLKLGQVEFLNPAEELHWWQMKRSDYNEWCEDQHALAQAALA